MTDQDLLDEARVLYAAWLAAEQAVATGQEYTIGPRTLRRADAPFIASQVSKYRARIMGLESGRGAGVRVFRVMPRDL